MNSTTTPSSGTPTTGLPTEHHQPTNEPKQGASVDDLGRRFTASSEDQDFARTMAENWQKLLGALVVVLLAVWLYEEFQSAAERRRAEASGRFSALQATFADLEKSEAKDGDAPSPAVVLQDTITQLSSSDAETVYAQLAPLYSAQAALSQGSLEAARGTLQQFGVADPAAIPAGTTVLEPKQFISELAALLYARLLVKDPNVERQAAASYAATLAERARFVNVEALLLLYRIAETEEARASAKEKARELIAARPELATTIQREFASAGASLEAPL
ncbi:MAG: tetratricopeptide repeat protein [Bdellovibrionales bacterium]|nr:tetratricopeptide repeat protein [Bdellovibrionales bacterium]